MLSHCGRYQLLGEVGSGAMGVVYRARDPKIDRLVALKVLRHEQTATESSIKRFLKEARAIGRLSHPNIVTVHDMGEEQGNVYFIMELVDGKSLSEILQQRRLALAEAVGIGVRIAEALDYAHRHGVIHQDVKPANILLSEDGRVKITDFGIARLQDATATVLTRAGEVMGTPSYMSPEQLENKTVDGRSDIFSLGVVLYTMVTGAKPFGGTGGTTLAGLLNEILNVTPPAPIAVSPGVPKRLSDLIERTLQKDPQRRFQTAGELAAALKNSLAPPPAPPVAGARATEAWTKFRRALLAKVAVPETRKVLLAAVAVATLAIVGIAYLSFQIDRSVPVIPPLGPQKLWPAPERKAPDPAPPAKTEAKAKEPELPADPAPDTRRTKVPEAGNPASPEEQTRPSADASGAKQPPPPVRRTPLSGITTPIWVITTPPGARVAVDGSLTRDATPLNVMLSPGLHRLRVTKAGYVSLETDVHVKETMEYPLKFTLEKIGASER